MAILRLIENLYRQIFGSGLSYGPKSAFALKVTGLLMYAVKWESQAIK